MGNSIYIYIYIYMIEVLKTSPILRLMGLGRLRPGRGDLNTTAGTHQCRFEESSALAVEMESRVALLSASGRVPRATQAKAQRI